MVIRAVDWIGVEERITTDFKKTLKTLPNSKPNARPRIQLLGRAYPISLQGVRDQRAQSSTRIALAGLTITSAEKMASSANNPAGPNPRSASESPSGRMGIASPAFVGIEGPS